MTDLRQAAQKALEALENDAMQRTYAGGVRITNAAIALRQALAEPQTTHWEGCEAVHPECRKPEQEPVAWYFVRDTERAISFAPDNDPAKPWQPLYTAPPGDVEPVAWMVYTDGGASAYVTDNPNDLVGAYRALPLYTAPTPRKPLTDEKIWNTYKNLWMFHPAEEPRLAGDVLKFARAIERAHGIGEQT